jgi:hypothetical protein
MFSALCSSEEQALLKELKEQNDLLQKLINLLSDIFGMNNS